MTEIPKIRTDVADAIEWLRERATWREENTLDELALRSAQVLTDIAPDHMHIYFLVDGKELAETTSGSETLYAFGIYEAERIGKALANIHNKTVRIYEDNTCICLKAYKPDTPTKAQE